MANRELPFSPIPTKHIGGKIAPFDADASEYLLIEPKGGRLHETRPLNEFAALLEAMPFEEPDPSREELLPLRDAIQDAIDNVLTERERYVFDAIVIERQSFRQLESVLSLSKSQVWRIHQSALSRLRAELSDHHLIKEYLNR